MSQKSFNTVEKQPNCTTESGKLEKGLNIRTEFKGNFEHYECKIQLKNIGLTDSGIWTCEMESYVFGPIRGTVQRKDMSLNVIKGQSKIELFNKLKLKLRRDPKYLTFI